jgi:tRNA uridine 5-carboxymethylaminomethyl modification enzyme
MGLNADATGIQFRMLNQSKGPSVRAPRVQCDKKAYQFRMKAILEQAPNLDVKQATVSRVLVDSGSIAGVETDLGVAIGARSVVITSGTFLRGLWHVGERSKPGGRMGDATSSLSTTLQQLGFQIGRFKTGTPCRLNARSIDFSRCSIQLGDEPPSGFAFHPEEISTGVNEIFTLNCVEDAKFHVEQLPCWITHTTETTHQIIRANLHRSPLYAGRIQGIGPRYCPSIEDKVVNSLTNPRISYFWNQKAGIPANTTSTEFQRVCHTKFSCNFSIQFRDSSEPKSCGPGMLWNMITSPQSNFIRHWKQGSSADFSLPGKSMALPGTKKRQLKG